MTERRTPTIRAERPEDRAAVFEVNEHAFVRPAEARLVEKLREVASPYISLVAALDEGIVGHIMFSPITLEPAQDAPKLMLGLGPMAVAPEFQRQGIGSQLVRAGLEACRGIGCEAVVVLGHPDYYPRFGFVPASRFGLTCEYPVPDEVFMAQELVPEALGPCRGCVKYHPAFADV